MLIFEGALELAAHAGCELGVSEWLTITQDLITRFAQVTGDTTWIHTDPIRAAREMPGGKTIAHGYLTLSVGPALMGQIYQVRRYDRILNYGIDNLRFLTPVPCGARLRLRLGLKDAARRPDGGFRFQFTNTIELEPGERAAAHYDMLVLMYEAAPQ
jgi:acyl dehydratase